jgi:hypothetical protein
MPLFGWNTDTTAIVPGQGTLTYVSHGAIINDTGPAGGGMGLRLFLEPVIQVTNYFKSLTGNLGDTTMLGLSGGGWTTSMIAALDPRIKLSFPVAGSAPLYLRNQFNWTGDTEESYPPLFDENIGAGGTGGGVATWLEIYALGGYGAARRQVMITNERDDCCFAGAYFADTFKTVVADVVVNQLSQGTWSHFLDTQSVQHEISTNAIFERHRPRIAEHAGRSRKHHRAPHLSRERGYRPVRNRYPARCEYGGEHRQSRIF